MDYKDIINKIIYNEENNDLFKLIISLYKSYFENNALNFIGIGKEERFNIQDFVIFKKKMMERFPNEDWNSVKDMDLLHYVIIAINRLEVFKA